MQRQRPKSSAARGCPDDDVLQGFVEGSLVGEELRRFEEHLDECEACRDATAAASATTTVPDREPTAGEPRESVSGHIGRYAILGHLGAGAMGIVLRAYDPKLEREVALKILRGELGEAGSARLVREAKAMAQLSHPNVVALYDVDIEPERVVVVMELIRGQTLASWMQDHTAWREVLDHFIQAGRGLAAAHAAGLLHRDFKPANVLVGKDERVRVTDFGIARAQLGPADPSAPGLPASDLGRVLTQDGVVVGTPAYMAPEQHRGAPLTPAADQYAFATALFEALTGSRPHTGLAAEALLTAKLRGAPAWPADGELPARLREAVSRALEPEPADRFPSMDAMLRAIAQRKHGVRRSGALVTVALGLAALGVTALVTQDDVPRPCAGAQDELADAWSFDLHERIGAAFTATELSYAERAWERNGPRLEAYAATWVSTYTEACEATAVGQSQSPEALDLRMACLHRARRILGATTAVLEGADRDVITRVGTMVDDLPPLARCSDLSALGAEIDPPSTEQMPAVELIRNRLATARAQRLAGKYVDARTTLTTAEDASQSTKYEPVRVEFLLEDAALAELESRYTDAAALLDEAIRLGSKWEQWPQVRSASRMSIFVAARLGRFDEAMALAPVARGLAEGSTNVADVAETHATLGAVALIRGRPREAETELRAALEGLVQAHGPSSRRVARVRANLAAALVELGRPQEAIEQFDQQIEVMTHLLGPDHPDVARTRQTLGNAHHRLGRLEDAEREHQTALDGRRAAFGEDHLEVADSLASLAAVHIDQGRYEDAEQKAHAAIEIQSRHGSGGRRASIVPASHLARVLSDRGQHGEAAEQYRRVVEDATELFGSENTTVALLRGALGHALHDAGELVAAETEFRASLEVRERDLGTAHRQTIENRLALARCIFDQNRQANAFSEYQRALLDLSSQEHAQSPELATARGEHGKALLDAGRAEAALVELEAATQIFDALTQPAPRAPDTLFALARARSTLGQPGEAIRAARRARALLEDQGLAGEKRLGAVEQWISDHDASE